MSEFDPHPTEAAPATPIALPPPKKQGFLTRPVFLGYSMPWLAGILLGTSVVAWYLFWPASTSQDISQRAFGKDAVLEAVQQPAATSVAHSMTPAPRQTGGLNVPATASSPDATGSGAEDMASLIREGREFEVANREAITRLSDTVRAQTKALTTLQQQLDGVAQENARLGNLMTVLAARPAADASGHAAGRKTTRSLLAGMRLESLQEGMAWVSWQGRTWAVQPGDSLGGVIVDDINAAERSVTTSAGVLR